MKQRHALAPILSHRLLQSTLLSIMLHLVFSAGYPEIGSANAFIKTTECDKTTSVLNCREGKFVEYIYIFGEIDHDTLRVIHEFDTKTPANIRFPIIYLNSNGGSLTPAMEIGRIFRRRRASVEGRDIFFPTRKSNCSSACTVIAAGATTRNLVHVGFHRPSTWNRIKGETYSVQEANKSDLNKLLEYYRKMGASPEVIRIVSNTMSSEMHEEILSLNKPFRSQAIVRFGFRARKPSGDEIRRIAATNRPQDDGYSALVKTAKEGDCEAAFKIGWAILHGKDGVRKNIQKAITWFQKSAECNNVYAQHMLGVIFSDESLPAITNDRIAFEYYKSAASQGRPGSQNNLGWFYYEGRGVKRNISEAIYWITRAVEQGEAFSYGSLAQIRFEGNGFEKDNIETYKWTKLADLNMPEGKAKDENRVILQHIKAEMTESEIARAELLAANWKPLKQTLSKMRDKEDK